MGFNYCTPAHLDYQFEKALAEKGLKKVAETDLNLDFVILHSYTFPSHALLHLEGQHHGSNVQDDLRNINYYYSAKAMGLPVVALRNTATLVHCLLGGILVPIKEEEPRRNTHKLMDNEGNFVTFMNTNRWVLPEDAEDMYEVSKKREPVDGNFAEFVESYSDYDRKVFGFCPSVGTQEVGMKMVIEDIDIFLNNC